MRSIGRVFSALDCFTAEQPNLSLQEISFRIGLAKSTTFRLVHTLESFGYLIRLADQRYTLSLKLCRLASVAETSIDVRMLARPALTELATASTERVTLHTIAGDQRSCIDLVSSTGAAATWQGQLRPFGLGADSLVLLAYMSHEASARLLPGVAEAVDCPLSEMQSILQNIRRDGWVVSHGGVRPGVSAIAAPIMGPDTDSRYCVAVTLSTARVRGRVAQLSRLVCKAAADISIRLGATDAAIEFQSVEPDRSGACAIPGPTDHPTRVQARSRRHEQEADRV